jgi:hypothetical protein
VTTSAKLELARTHIQRAAAELAEARLYLEGAKEAAAFFAHTIEGQRHVDRLARYTSHVQKQLATERTIG